MLTGPAINVRYRASGANSEEFVYHNIINSRTYNLYVLQEFMLHKVHLISIIGSSFHASKARIISVSSSGTKHI